MRSYIALDPGATTGLVYLPAGATEPAERHQFTTMDAADFVQDTWEAGGWTKESPLVVIRERFTISKRTISTTRQYDALYLNGWLIHYFRHLRPGDGIVLLQQTPSQGKGFGTDDKLKAAGWYVPGEGHANDAARHLLLACAIDHAEGRMAHPELMSRLEGML